MINIKKILGAIWKKQSIIIFEVRYTEYFIKVKYLWVETNYALFRVEIHPHSYSPCYILL